MNRKVWKWILLVLTLLVMIMIFCFSCENAEKSDQTSGVIVETIAPIVEPDYKTLPAPEKKVVYDTLSLVVRKIAHFSEFALLGFMIRLTLEAWFGDGKRRFSLIALGCGAFYACTDELHQLWVSARSGQVLDVLIDTAGVAAGITVAWVLMMLIKRHMDKKKVSGC